MFLLPKKPVFSTGVKSPTKKDLETEPIDTEARTEAIFDKFFFESRSLSQILKTAFSCISKNNQSFS